MSHLPRFCVDIRVVPCSYLVHRNSKIETSLLVVLIVLISDDGNVHTDCKTCISSEYGLRETLISIYIWYGAA